MSCFEIYYDGGAKKMRPINNFKEYAAIRNSAKNRRNTKLAREGNDEAKRKMVQFCYSCLPNDDGTLKGSKRVSNSVGMDIDFAKDMPKDELESATKMMIGRVLQMKDDLGLLMLERSATKGLHIVFKRIGWLNQEENLEWAQKLLGVEFDKGAKDITRVFFTPTASDEDLLFLSDDLFINKEVETAANPPAVGADPCVRPTTVGRTESAKEVEAKDGNGKEEANAKSAEICRSDIGRTHGSAPTGGSCTQSTTGGSCTQSTTGGSCTQSTTGGSCTQSTTIGTCTFMRYLTPHL